MRYDTLVRRAANSSNRYLEQLRNSRYSANDAAHRLASNFGPSVQQLPPSLRIELLLPRLQRLPQRQTLFANLNFIGRTLLNIMVNDHLGTRNVDVPAHVVQHFCDIRGIGSEVGREYGPSLVYNCVGAVNIFSGEDVCREMVRSHILGGTQGLANMFLDDLFQQQN